MENLEIDYREAIQKSFDSLGRKKQKIARYILQNPLKTVGSSVQTLASACDCEQTTIVRFAKQLGFSGISELKIAIARQSNMIWNDFSVEKASSEQVNVHPVLTQLSNLHCDCITQTLNGLSPDTIEKLMHALEENTGIMTFGSGTSKLAAADLATKFSRLGIHCYNYEDAELSKTFSGYLGKHGLIFLISNSGETDTVLTLAALAKQENIKIAAITSYPQSHLGKLADFLLITNSHHEKPVRFGAMTSRLAQFAVVDAITLLYSMSNQDRSWHFISQGYHREE